MLAHLIARAHAARALAQVALERDFDVDRFHRLSRFWWFDGVQLLGSSAS